VGRLSWIAVARRGVAWRAAICCACAFAVLTLAVAGGLTGTLDRRVARWARPHRVWGPAQMHAETVVEWLRPAALIAPLVAVLVVVCLRRRSVRPLLMAAAAAAPAIVTVLVVKVALRRNDPGGDLVGFAGSFPSGHTFSLTACCGLVVLLVRPAARRWVWLVPAVPAVVMAGSLLVVGAHWFTDVIGGALVAVTALSAVRATGADRWAAAERPPDDPLPEQPAPEPTGDGSDHDPGGAKGVDGADAVRR
jgi:undecaprenyl-diphosphatase